MTKRGPIIIGIVIVALLVSPFAIGMFTENRVREQMALYDDNPMLSATISSYDRSWFDSEAHIDLRLSPAYMDQIAAADPTGMAAQALSNFTLPIIVEFSHGPVLLQPGFGVGTTSVRAYADPSAPMIRIAQTLLQIPYLFEFRGQAGFGTGFHFEGDIPEFEGTLGDFTYRFAGVDLTGVARRGSLQYEATLPEFLVQMPGLSLLIETLTLAVDQMPRPESMPLGTTGLSVDRVVVTNPLAGATPVFAANQLSLSSAVRENDDGTHINLSVVYALQHMEIADAFTVDDAALGVTLGHLDAVAFEGLRGLSSQIGPGTDEEAMLQILEPIGDRLLAGDPALLIDPVRFSLPEGQFTARANIQVNSSALPSGRMRDLMVGGVGLGALTASARASAPKPLVQMVARLIMEQSMGQAIGADGEPLSADEIAAMANAQASQILAIIAAQGFIVDEGDSYSTELSLDNGALSANGQPMPFLL